MHHSLFMASPHLYSILTLLNLWTHSNAIVAYSFLYLNVFQPLFSNFLSLQFIIPLRLSLTYRHYPFLYPLKGNPQTDSPIACWCISYSFQELPAFLFYASTEAYLTKHPAPSPAPTQGHPNWFFLTYQNTSYTFQELLASPSYPSKEASTGAQPAPSPVPTPWLF